MRALRQEAGETEDDAHLLARIDALLALLGTWLDGSQRLDDEALRRLLRHGTVQDPP
ncbi:hypothetical protein [Cupriavidus necator]|uniref:hypothetical protein n=1 Tax=Cupriavidus necator TaxID=106590 RepID=UPI000A50471E|nr:hypothetical protein [Cupriavidus necator]